MTQPELDGFHEPVGTIEDAIFRCKKHDQFGGGGRPSAYAWDVFLEYHKDRPEIFTAFRKATKGLIAQGVKHFGSMDILGKVRWEAAFTAPDEDHYKCGNTAHPFLARVFMEFEPKYQGFFKIKTKPLTGIMKATKEVEHDTVL